MARIELSPDGATIENARLPFKEQIAFFRQKLGNLIPTRRWDDIRKNEHDRGFMVAGAMKADLLADLARAVDLAVAEGKSIQWFRKQFFEIVAKHGWTDYTGSQTKKGRAWRTRVIYQTNLLASYSAGRLAQLKEAGYRYFVYHHDDSVRHPRPLHQAWDGLTLPADHEFWQSHYPPNGWGCQCYISGARSERGARRLGGDPGKKIDPEWLKTDPKTGAPVGIDQGWDYQPGATVVDTVRALAPKLAQAPPRIGVALGEDLRPGIVSAWNEWIEDVLKDRTPRGRHAIVGVLEAAELAFLEHLGKPPARADISIEDRLIVGKKARRHQDQGNAVSEDEWRNLAQSLTEPEAVLYDTETGNVLYVLPSAANRRVKVVVTPDFMAKKRPVENSVRSAFRVGVEALLDRRRYRVIRGRIKR